MRSSHIATIALLFLARVAAADETGNKHAPAGVAEPDMEVVLVTGVQPGPALWKVSSGDHVLWILGEVSPFARRVKWKSNKFERLLRNSQELILDFSGYWRADETEIASYVRAEKLPDGVTLKDVISPELHLRVKATAKSFGATELDRLYPFSVTNRLVVSAMDSLGLNGFSARFAAEELGQKRNVKITYFAAPELAFEDRLENWQDAANSVCLERLLDAIEDGGNGVKRLANAWAIGDIPALRSLVPAYSFSRDGFRADECAAAMRGGERQARDYKMRRTQFWLDEAERALKDNRSTMAVVLMSEIFAPDGYLAGLRARGYEIVEPE